MKKLILAFGLLFALSLTSCFSDENAQNKEQADTTKVELTANVPTDVEVTGVAVDGAMNSISLKVGEDTVDFSYPDLESENRDTWDINDTVTVRYVETESGDSVTSVINKSA